MRNILKNESVKQTYIHVAGLEIYFPGILKDFKNYSDWFVLSASLFLGSIGMSFETDWRRRAKTVCLFYAKEVLNLIRSILPKDVKGKIWKMQKTYH